LKELHTRTIWGFLFATVLTAAILWGPLSFAILFLILAFYALNEFYTLCREAGYSPQVYPALATGTIIFILSYLSANQSLDYKSFIYLLPLIYASPVYELFRKKKDPIVNLALTAFGLIYVTIPFSLLNFLAFHQTEGLINYHYELLISLFIFVWASDSGAYLLGVRFGRHRLFERISPKKSWEGLIGGVVTALIAAWILSFIFPHYSPILLAIMAMLVVIAGTFGDLVESMIKRSIGVKDSGKFMPGHGGLLDRFDSILLASPVIYFVVRFFL